jgi:hypothetical protein
MSWIPWSDKSVNILFKSSVKGVGDGEEKVSKELDTVILGQNMEPYINGIKVKCEIKKLDRDNDFNTGEAGSNALCSYKTLHFKLFQCFKFLTTCELFTQSERDNILQLSIKKPDELCVSVITNIYNTVKMLSAKKIDIQSQLPKVLCNLGSELIDIPIGIDDIYTICERKSIPFPHQYTSYIEPIRAIRNMEHVYIDQPDRFIADLQSLVYTVFAEITLIFVDEKKGFFVVNDLSKIKFLRITRGRPRFKVEF